MQEAGRKVRIGIVSFGLEGREKVDLDLTDSLDTVKAALDDLLVRYDRESHSDGPGEASYHGLSLVASKLSWSAAQRFAIVVTDEGSKELLDRSPENDSYVAGVNAALKSSGVDTSVYTIVVR